MGSFKYALTSRPWCRECSNSFGPDAKGRTTYYYVGDYGPLCSEKCAEPFVEMRPDVTKSGRTRKGVWTSNLVRIEARPAPKKRAARARQQEAKP